MSRHLNRDTKGVYAISPTPFTQDGAVDFESLDRLMDFYAECGADGVTVLGQLGEASKLDAEELVAVAQRAARRSSLPVVVGVTSGGLASMKRLTSTAMDAGAVGVMIGPPTTLRTDESIVGYYDAVVEAIGTDVPFVIQDFPLVFQVVMSAGVIASIAARHESCVMLKHEDWPGLDKVSRIREMEAEGLMPRLSILGGNGALFYDFELERGSDGAMTGYCFPEMLVGAHRLASEGRREEMHDLFDAHLPLVRYEQQPGVGLAVRKYVLTKRGILGSPRLRWPSAWLSPTTTGEVDYLLDRVYARDPAVLPTG